MAEAEGSGPQAPRSMRVLLVDDHPLIREGVRTILEEGGGFQVVGEAATGSDAVRLARELQPDVVLMDIEMPDMDGLAATRAIKSQVPAASVVILTSFHNTDYLREAVLGGASGFLLKGVEPEVLRESVALLRNGESIVDTRLLAEMLQQLPSRPPATAGPAAARATGTPYGLSAFELQVLRGVVDGLSNGEIATQLHYSVGTIKNAVQRIIEKLGVSDRTQAAVRAVREGIVPD